MDNIRAKTSADVAYPNYIVSYTLSILCYAHIDREFAEELRASIRSLDFDQSGAPGATLPPTPWLIPQNMDEAIRRCDWLLQELAYGSHEGSREARALLASWARHNSPEPQEVIIGIVGIAIIGPTLGLIKTKRRRKKYMQILLSPVAGELPKRRYMALLEYTSVELLVRELAKVRGDAYALEPDLADWFFGDKELQIATAENATLKDIAKELRQHHLPHTASVRDGDIECIALSPSIDPNYILERRDVVTERGGHNRS